MIIVNTKRIRSLFFFLMIIGGSKVSGQQRMGDGLGNHRATASLQMNANSILNASGMAIGTAALVSASVAFQVDGVDKAVLFPRVTSLVSVLAPLNGMMVYNSADNKFYVRQAGVWVNFVNMENSGIAKYTTAQRDLITSPASDMIIFNTTTRTFQIYDSTVPGWVAIGIVAGGGTAVSTAIMSATSSKPDTAFAGGTVVSEGSSAVTARGVCWNTATTPTVANFTTISGAGLGEYTSTLWGLVPATLYYVRAYAVNAVGTVYGTQRTFTSGAALPPILAATAEATDLTAVSAVSGGTVTSDRGANVTARGVCYATTPLPVRTGNIVAAGTGTGSFTAAITGLTVNTTYYVRAYATNSGGTAYGAQETFTTLANLPTVTTATAAPVAGGLTATGGGNVTATGGAAVTARGVVYSSTLALPTVELSAKTTDASGTGAFTSTMTGLAQNTIYYVRAYGTNTRGTFYGPAVQFTSNGIPISGSVTISNITNTSATLSSVASGAGGGTITAKGFVANTSGSPVLPSTVGTAGTGTAAFTNNGVAFAAATTYYVRSYATNSLGTDYSEQVVFTTSGSLNLDYTGGQQAFVVPAGVTSISLLVNGATGGNAASKGGQATGQLAVSPGQILYVFIGGAPANGAATLSAGGYNGGGTGTGINSGGGGASDIRLGGTELTNRIIVAGGGGGNGNTYGNGGGGGGTFGVDGISNLSATNTGKGGTQTAGGAAAASGGNAGVFGQGATGGNATGSGAGGGGYYGGGSGNTGGGGGGSGYIGGVTGGGLTSNVSISVGNGRVVISW